MTAAPRVHWIDALPRRPLCDVPWVGNTMVTSDGQVLLCCFSDAVVGNVHQQPFEQVWNNPTMARIRASLVEHRLPPECQTGSCPVFRGDTRHYLVERRDGGMGDDAATQAQAVAAQRLAGSRIELSCAVAHPGTTVTAALHLCYAGDPEAVDVFSAVRAPDGSTAFWPHRVDVPLPMQTGWRVEGAATLTVLELPIGADTRRGEHELCVALFVPGSDPNLRNHCYWAASATFTVAG